jgi:aminoglycoside phosphotransferase (APT) family kinase protein
MHADELDLDEALVRRLLAEQFPAWADLPLHRVEASGTVNAIFRLGDELSVRLPRREGPTQPGGKELAWLPRLAPLLPVEIPRPVAQGRPSGGYPWFWAGAISQSVAALAYYTPENNPALYHEAESWLELALSEPD